MSLCDTIIKEYIDAVGSENVFIEEIPDHYNSDKTSGLRGKADAVILPGSTHEVSAIVTICYNYGIPVITRGSGTGVTGGAVPLSGGIVLSLERMNHILEIDEENLTATVEPCVKTGDLQRHVLERGLLYPPDPASLDDCSIGGNVAESAGGMRAVKYGTTKDYVIGLEFINGEGKIMHTGGKFVKNATGFNLIGVLTGSEGTLAILTKITLRLIPAPALSNDILCAFPSLENACDAVLALSRSRIIPTTIEFMESDALELVRRHINMTIPFPESKAQLLIQIDGPSQEDVDRECNAVIKTIESLIIGHSIARTEEDRAKLWKVRRSIRTSIEQESPIFLAEDCVVPRASIPEFVKSLKEHFSKHNLRSILFGHAGDGNVHIDVLRDSMDDEKWNALIHPLKHAIYDLAIRYGGTISGEHGIGSVRRSYLALAFSEDELVLMRNIKKAFDPKGILNPGKGL